VFSELIIFRLFALLIAMPSARARTPDYEERAKGIKQDIGRSFAVRRMQGTAHAGFWRGWVIQRGQTVDRVLRLQQP
jgi:hypothetical protein